VCCCCAAGREGLQQQQYCRYSGLRNAGWLDECGTLHSCNPSRCCLMRPTQAERQLCSPFLRRPMCMRVCAHWLMAADSYKPAVGRLRSPAVAAGGRRAACGTLLGLDVGSTSELPDAMLSHRLDAAAASLQVLRLDSCGCLEPPAGLPPVTCGAAAAPATPVAAAGLGTAGAAGSAGLLAGGCGGGQLVDLVLVLVGGLHEEYVGALMGLAAWAD
jgi:hypothetical protein